MSKYMIPSNLAVSDTGFLFMPSTGETFTLNEIGREIFKLLQKGMTEDEVVSSICERYDCDAPTCRKDLDDFLGQLKNYSLLSEL